MKSLIRTLYRLIPFKKQLFSFIRTFYIPPPGIFRHLHFQGIFTVKTGPVSQYKIQHYGSGFLMETELFWKGYEACEKTSLRIWSILSQKASVILDIGSNTGIYALTSASLNQSAVIYAFEPVPKIFQKLKENNDLNNQQLQLVRKIVSDTNGTLTLFGTSSENPYTASVNQAVGCVPTENTTANATRLDSFIRESFIPEISLMKIDVEGHEDAVLNGMGEYLHHFRPVMLIEILTDEVADKLYKLTEGLNYLYFNVDEEKGIQQKTKPSRSTHNNYLFCHENQLQILKAEGVNFIS